MADEKIHVRSMPADAICEAHDWPTDGLGLRLVAAMRERHGKGGFTICVPCIGRARGDAEEKRKGPVRLSSVPVEDVRVGDSATFDAPNVYYGRDAYLVEAVGSTKLKVSCDVRFAPDGPLHHQAHVFPRAHLKEVFRQVDLGADANPKETPW